MKKQARSMDMRAKIYLLVARGWFDPIALLRSYLWS